MIGIWLGYYKYDNEKAQKAIGFEQTAFTIIIDSFSGRIFKGSVIDDIGSGGMEGEGRIVGEIIDNTVSFQKHMPRATFAFKDASRKVINRKHPVIYYFGTISQDGKEMKGSWKFKTQIVFLFGIVPFLYIPYRGTWNMKMQ